MRIAIAVMMRRIAIAIEPSELSKSTVMEHPWAANSVTIAISFAVVFRTNIAWSRYWEAAQQVQFMFSKWADSFMQLVSFINSTERALLAEYTDTEPPESIVGRLEAL